MLIFIKYRKLFIISHSVANNPAAIGCDKSGSCNSIEVASSGRPQSTKKCTFLSPSTMPPLSTHDLLPAFMSGSDVLMTFGLDFGRNFSISFTKLQRGGDNSSWKKVGGGGAWKAGPVSFIFINFKSFLRKPRNGSCALPPPLTRSSHDGGIPIHIVALPLRPCFFCFVASHFVFSPPFAPFSP